MVETDYVLYDTGRGQCLSLLGPDHVAEYGLAPQAIMGQVSSDPDAGDPLTPETFVANGAFHEFLHGVVAQYAPKLSDFADEAHRQHDGYLCIVDQRTPTPAGRVPPEDVIGCFEVRTGHLVHRSYQAMPTHRLMTDRGFFQLGPELEQCLRFELEQLRAS